MKIATTSSFERTIAPPCIGQYRINGKAREFFFKSQDPEKMPVLPNRHFFVKIFALKVMEA
jgi:hypothetical protein